MVLLWPRFLLLLGLIPLLIAVYLWVLRRRRRYAVRFSSLSLVREALPRSSRLKRHLPFAFFLLSLASLAFATSRPVATVDVPVGRATVILAMDVSGSMCSTDVPPNRLEAAKTAAQTFVQRQSGRAQIGIVAFAGFASIVQLPTTDQAALMDALEGLTIARRTAIGSAILESLNAISEIDPNIPSTGSDPDSTGQALPEGTYVPDIIIVLLTDGASNSGPFPLDAAQEAAEAGIRVYTIGYGTDQGGVMNCPGTFWRGSGGGGGFRRSIDEPTLIQIADITGGEYYSASSAGELSEVFENLPTHLVTRQETTEISVFFAAIGVLLVSLAVVLAMLWNPLL